MKTSNLISAALLALGIVAQAGAQTPVVYLTGSTAFRAAVFSALSSTAGPGSGGVFDASPAVEYTTYGNSSANGGTYMVFYGNVSGSPVWIDCAWSGSEAGIASACNTTLTNQDRNGNSIILNGSPETWLNVSNVTVAVGGSGEVISTNPASGSGFFEATSHGADLAQSDTSQAISWTPPVANTPTALQDFGVEAIVTFTLSRNVNPFPSNEWTHCSNITLPQLNTLFSSGWVPAGFISGNPTDDDFNVYLVGRNLGSGTRMNALGDSQYGAHKAVKQYSIGFGIEAPQSTHLDELVLTNEGNNGYESGGDVSKALGIINTNNGTGSCQQADPFHGGLGWFAIGYVSPSDALNTGNFGGAPTNNWVTVDGVLSSDGSIENGSWWLWGHEHLYGREGISGTALTVGNLLAPAVTTQITSVLNYGQNPAAHDLGIPTGLMNVTKASDVAYPLP
ncbi:MAG TPA: hypothetical protein VNU95_12800 [Candidatus Acidoferrales bacterium]|jgi:hypothetical protein|nr:hypothetical protein [Candidatus Acidoferrales bacterium]